MSGCLTLVRHGESIWNQQNRFTGWIDVALSSSGMKEAVNAGELLQNKYFDVAFTSALLRAQDTLYEILKQNRHCDQYMRVHELSSTCYEHFVPTKEDQSELKVYVSEKLNERYYGDLQGKEKEEAKRMFGKEKIRTWRRSYDVPPPNGESLAMTAARVIPYYQQHILPRLLKQESILISAHGNSLRALIMHIEQMTPKQIMAYELATGTPHIYHFNTTMHVFKKEVITKK